MAKFKHRTEGFVVEAIWYDGSKKSFERAKAYLEIHDFSARRMSRKHKYWPNCIYAWKKESTRATIIPYENWLFIYNPSGNLYTDNSEFMFSVYKSVRASTPLT